MSLNYLKHSLALANLVTASRVKMSKGGDPNNPRFMKMVSKGVLVTIRLTLEVISCSLSRKRVQKPGMGPLGSNVETGYRTTVCFGG